MLNGTLSGRKYQRGAVGCARCRLAGSVVGYPTQKYSLYLRWSVVVHGMLD